MKVLLINGSPHEKGCTYTALREVADALEKEGVETHIRPIGTKPVLGCIACGQCTKTRRCSLTGDICNALIEEMAASDGLVVGSPVYYAGPNGALCALLDRMFYAGSSLWKFRPAAAVVSCRRAGSTAALDRLNKYFTLNQMPQVSSAYWNMVHGNNPDEVRQDKEGLQIMQMLGTNMAWLLRSLEKGEAPAHKKTEWTNFIR